MVVILLDRPCIVSKECVNCACDPSMHLDVSPIRMMFVKSFSVVCHPVFNPTVVLSVADFASLDLFVCGCRTWICIEIDRFYGEQCHPPSGSAWPACPENGISVPRWGGGRGGVIDTICTVVAKTAVISPSLIGCVVCFLFLSLHKNHFHSLGVCFATTDDKFVDISLSPTLNCFHLFSKCMSVL